MTVTLLVATALVAVSDWIAVHLGLRLRRIPAEFALKPSTMVLLIAAVASASSPASGGLTVARPWLLAGLAFGLLGDVALMLGNDQHAAGAIENSARATGDHGRATGEDGRATGEGEALDTADTGGPDLAFIAGLGAFLVGHLFYLVAFVRVGVHPFDVLLGVIVAAAVAVVALPPVLRGAVRAEGRAFAGIVAVYAGLLAAMTALAVGTAVALTALGGVLFLVSDTLLARGRFVGPVRHGALLVIVTYHVAQLLIVIGVIRTT